MPFSRELIQLKALKHQLHNLIQALLKPSAGIALPIESRARTPLLAVCFATCLSRISSSSVTTRSSSEMRSATAVLVFSSLLVATFGIKVRIHNRIICRDALL